MLKTLTKEQESKLSVYRDKFISLSLENKKEADIDEVTKYMHWFYKKFNLSNVKPKVILVDSPIAVLKAIQEKRIEEGETDVKIEWFEPSYNLSTFNSWISFYDFFDKECFKLEISELFNQYKEILDLNIFWSVPFDKYVFVSKNAVKYNRDEQFNLHSVHEPAIIFKDGYHQYFVHGVFFTDELFMKVKNKQITFEELLKEQNEEIKAAIMSMIEELFGTEYLAKFISDVLTEVDTYVDKKSEKFLEKTTKGMNIGVYTLLKGKIDNTELSYIRCYCPSTDRMFFLGADTSINNAKDAIASLYRIPKKLVDEIKYINRQGERFSTVFTEKGYKILKTLSKEDIGDLTHISGDKYFSLIRYEY